MTGRGGSGCFLRGCLIAVVIAAVLTLTLGFFIYRQIYLAMDGFTSAAATPVPTAAFSFDEAESGREKLALLTATIGDRNQSGDFKFSAEELNGILAFDPRLSGLNKKVHVELNGSAATLRFSTRLADLGNWPALDWFSDDMCNRFVNGAAYGSILIVNGKPSVTLTSLKLGSETFPEYALGQAAEWFAGALESLVVDDTEGATALTDRVGSLRIEEGALVISVKPARALGDAKP